MQKGTSSSFNGRMRDELLNESLFIDLDQARQLIGAWATDYNTARPHSSLGYKTPAAYAGTLTAPKGVTLAEGSNRRWMNIQWQVTDDPAGSKHNELVDPRPPNRYTGSIFRGGESLHSASDIMWSINRIRSTNIQDRQLPVAKSKS